MKLFRLPVFIAFIVSLVPAVFAQTSSQKRLAVPGAMLDDYEPTERGVLAVTFGAGYSKVPAGYDTWYPSGDFNLGLTKWLDIGISGSMSKSVFQDFQTTALGDSYISSKIRLLKEGKRRPGIAFQPVLEILGRPSLAQNALAPNKVNGAFGVIVGKNLHDWLRVYNHSGYFTRGIFFSSAAVEINRFTHVTPVAFASWGALTAGRDTAAELLLNSSRPDLGGSLGVRISKNWSAYGSVSRSFGRRDLNSVTVTVGGGITYTLRLWGRE